MQFIKIEDGKVVEHISTNRIPDKSLGYTRCDNFSGVVGMNASWLKNDYTLMTGEELIAAGIIEDPRGDYYHIKTKQKIVVEDIFDSTNLSSFTKKIPSFMPYEYWNGEGWEDNAEEKAKYEEEIELNKAYSYLTKTDYKVIKAMERGVSLEAIYPGETAAREKARDTIRKLTDGAEVS